MVLYIELDNYFKVASLNVCNSKELHCNCTEAIPNINSYMFVHVEYLNYLIPHAMLSLLVCTWYVYTSGQITSEESIFTYEPGEDAANFSVPNHIPPFLDEVMLNLTGNLTLTNVCGNNVECLFDLDQTGDVEVGMAAIEIENETAIEMQEACK